MTTQHPWPRCVALGLFAVLMVTLPELRAQESETPATTPEVDPGASPPLDGEERAEKDPTTQLLERHAALIDLAEGLVAEGVALTVASEGDCGQAAKKLKSFVAQRREDIDLVRATFRGLPPEDQTRLRNALTPRALILLAPAAASLRECRKNRALRRLFRKLRL